MADHPHGTEGPAGTPAAAAIAPLDCEFRLDTLVAARHDVQNYARTTGVDPDRLYKFVVAVNEIMTNAIHHGGGAGRVRLWQDGGFLHCEVSDWGQGMPRGRANGFHRPEPGTIGGWGLWLIRNICDQVEIQTGRTGTTVSVRYAIAAAPV